MHSFETSKTGAAVNRRTAKKNPISLLIELIEADPTADARRIYRQWKPLIDDDEDYREAVEEYAFTNYWEALERDRRKPKRNGHTVNKQTIKAETAEIVKMVEKAKGIVLMSLTLPNGKKLKDSTFAECSKVGGWFKLVATKGKPSEIVGKVLTEADLHKIK